LAAKPTPDDSLNEDLSRRLESAESEVRELRAEVGHLRKQAGTLSTIDVVTGLLNRTGFIDAIDMSLARFARLQERFAVALVGFPVLEETAARHPEETREEVLRHLAALFRAGLRGVDRAARLDGFLFGTVTPMLDEPGAPALITRLNGILAAAPVQIGGEAVEPRPHYSVAVVRSAPPKDAGALVILAEESHRTASVERPEILTL
jgi:PleD family two-component response regulator